jgi:Fe2+ transport system protein FeoA
VRICQLEAPPEVAARLREAGLYESQVIRLVSAGASLICLVCNTRLALSRELASTIHVMPVVSAGL